MPARTIRVTVNGFERSVTAEPTRLLLAMLRDDLGLTGTKQGCGIGVCGACTVVLDGKAMSACLTLIGACEGREVLTIEGLAHGTELHPIQRAFLEHGAVQCGFCTPGQIMSAYALLRQERAPSAEVIREAMLGNLCRCTGYYAIGAAIESAAKELTAR